MQIKIRFNKLVRQFENNDAYAPVADDASDFIIPDNEDISYEMLVNDKRYEASFIQKLDIDSTEIANIQKDIVLKYTEEELSAPSDELVEEMQIEFISQVVDLATMKMVWFTISQTPLGNYKILMYYDNKRNEANGQDL